MSRRQPAETTNIYAKSAVKCFRSYWGSSGIKKVILESLCPIIYLSSLPMLLAAAAAGLGKTRSANGGAQDSQNSNQQKAKKPKKEKDGERSAAAKLAPQSSQGQTGNDTSAPPSAYSSTDKGKAADRLDCVEKLAVQLDARLRVVESASLFALLPSEHHVSVKTREALAAYMEKAKAHPADHGQGAPEQVVAAAALRSLADCDPQVENDELKVKFTSFKKLALMALMSPEDLSAWAPQAYCAEAYAREGAAKKTKLSLTLRGWIEVNASLEVETKTVATMAAAVQKFHAEGAEAQVKKDALKAFLAVSPLSPLQVGFKPQLGEGSTLMEVQYLTQVALLTAVAGVECKAGKAPLGDAAYKVSRRRGKRGGRKADVVMIDGDL